LLSVESKTEWDAIVTFLRRVLDGKGKMLLTQLEQLISFAKVALGLTPDQVRVADRVTPTPSKGSRDCVQMPL
jgi:hypothetical protein